MKMKINVHHVSLLISEMYQKVTQSNAIIQMGAANETA